jgi:hypothetical protein
VRATAGHAPDASRRYRHVLIVESRGEWPACRENFDPALDVVLTYDFGLHHAVRATGGNAFYVDNLVDPARMEESNFRVYEFFRNWHRDGAGADLFTYRDIAFGFAFRLDIWNDLIFHARMHACLARVSALSYEKLIVTTRQRLIEPILQAMGVAFTEVPLAAPESTTPVYYFPIHRWMDEKVRSTKFRHRLKPAVAACMGRARLWLQRWRSASRRPRVFVQEYYPTREILGILERDPSVDVLLAQYSWTPGLMKLLTDEPVPVWGRVERFQETATRLMEQFIARRSARLVLADGVDATDSVVAIIERRVRHALPEVLRMLDCVVRYLERRPIALEVMISNLGRMHALVDAVCKARGGRSYLIVNGMLAHAYLDEAKYADVINCYSSSMREHYFRGMDNVVCLGDPRMDRYANIARRSIDRTNPTVTIGASGHNITNLASHVAVEFEFLYDVLSALATLRSEGVQLRVIIKVRDNGYREQYEAFVAEYFQDLVAEILHVGSIAAVLARTDFYVSIYSQTLFEASCMGIPCLYYKNDTETIYPPFDGASELVTVRTVADFSAAFRDFLAGGPRFDAFLERATMEKYIGFLDGRNTERNLEQIRRMIGDAVSRVPA